MEDLSLIEVFTQHKSALMAFGLALAAWAWSEIMGANPGWKSNGIVQFIGNAIFKGKK